MRLNKDQAISLAISLFRGKGYLVEENRKTGGRVSRVKIYTDVFGTKYYLYDLEFYRNFRGQYGIMLVPSFYTYTRYKNNISDTYAKNLWEWAVIKLWKSNSNHELLQYYSWNIETKTLERMLHPFLTMGKYMSIIEGECDNYLPARGGIFTGDCIDEGTVYTIVDEFDELISELDGIQ